MSFPLSLRAFIRDAECPHSQCVRLHLKVLQAPAVSLKTMLLSMRDVCATRDIGVSVASREALTGPAFATLLDIDVGTCNTGMGPTAEQTQLFANRNNVDTNDIVIYFVRTTVPGSNGCGVFPADRPGAVVTGSASRWTMAHEIGHVLGLAHISGEGGACTSPDFTRLMTGCGTGRITGTPTIAETEGDAMRNSNLTVDC